ncbi:MAG: 3-oxoacyl-[acyl-carrier protein] reductase [Frankiales bacterium]|jgi:NAD(P)-dependent dehydrogenase (short-subunit alcohol dehydrogenase family)|nr:3-oxoacyl-[acyl-carrier protein] reductase [Frankiales bacterium]
MGNTCTDRVALITGASRGGTGTVSAIRLAAEGARVAIVARSIDGLQRSAEEIEGFGGTVLVLPPCDLSDPAGGRDQLVAQVEGELGPIDILVNNAAVNGFQPFDEWSYADIQHRLELNLIAPWLLMQQVVPGMRARGRGWVVNLTTFCAENPPGPPYPTNKPSKAGAAYGASKAALNRLTLSVASECEGTGVAVNALSPQAAIATPDLVEGGWIKGALFEPLETMAEAVLALATADPNTLTGRIAYSLQLLVELERPVRDLHGDRLIDGWQPADLPTIIGNQATTLEADFSWQDPFTFRRASSPDFAG